MMKKSFIRQILTFLIILMILLFAILGFFLVSSFRILEEEMNDSSNTFLEIYSNELNNSIANMDNYLKNVTSQTVDLARLKSSNENERVFSTILLHNYMTDTLSNSRQVDGIIIYDELYGICLDAVTSHIRYDQKKRLREHTIDLLAKETSENIAWNFVTIDNHTYIYKQVKSHGRVIVIYTKMQNLLTSLETEDDSKRSIFLTDNTGTIGKIWGLENNEIRVGSIVSDIDKSSYYDVHTQVVKEQLYLYCYTSKDIILQQVHSGMFIVGAAVLIALMFLHYILYYTKRAITRPMKTIIEAMECIKKGDYDKRIQDEFDTAEFDLLESTTNQMVDEIVGLKIQTYEKKIQVQDMQLKSIRLQLKPHFFLNALTTISSLSGQNRNAQIITYIDALSRNIRYMFRTGFHTVPIKEEIRHVKNYFEMQDLKYPNCVFYFVDMPEELSEWRIPQMLIHTFIENEYKYAIQMEATLTVLIKISKQIYKESEMLLIEIEDDGMGYPQEVLDYMKGKIKKIGTNGNRVGLWSIKRMMELMYEQEDLVIIDNIIPHGCMNRIYVPEKPKHELLEENF